MTPPAAETLDEAYARLHLTGPEFDGWLSNHGPMVAEAMVRHGHGAAVGSWLDGYMPGLAEFPGGTGPIGADWPDALGDPRRIADWTAYFERELAGQPWREVLNAWWLRLLPGVVAAATHGVIRVGHAVRALSTDGADDIRIAELAHGLGYWAARWQTMPAGHAGAAAAAAAGRARARARPPAELLAAVPRISDQSGGILGGLGRLGRLPGWPETMTALTVPATPAQIRARLADLVDAATRRYLRYGHGNGVMLVHSATAPNAVLRTLPALDERYCSAGPRRGLGREQRADRRLRPGRSRSPGSAAAAAGRGQRRGSSRAGLRPGGRARRRACDQVRRHGRGGIRPHR